MLVHVCTHSYCMFVYAMVHCGVDFRYSPTRQSLCAITPVLSDTCCVRTVRYIAACQVLYTIQEPVCARACVHACVCVCVCVCVCAHVRVHVGRSAS